MQLLWLLPVLKINGLTAWQCLLLLAYVVIPAKDALFKWPTAAAALAHTHCTAVENQIYR